MAVKLTDILVKNAAPEKGRRKDIWDTQAPGLVLRVGARRKAWYVVYRRTDKPEWMHLGTYPAVKLVEARKAARAALDAVENREDPKQQPEEVLPDNAREAVPSVVDDFIRLHVEARLKPRTARSYKSELARIKKRWQVKPITRVSRRDVLDVTEGFLAEGKAAQANLTHRILGKFFTWCVERGVIPSSPMAGLKPPGKVAPRDRVLSDDELRTVWEAAGRVGYPWGTMARLLLVTAQRETEVVHMQRGHVRDGVWTMPDTKRGSPHSVTLPQVAQREIDGCPKFTGPYVLTTTSGAKPIGWLSEAKRLIDVAVEELHADGWPQVDPWRFHDLRRTAASGMARLGVAPHVIEAVLNHRTGTVSGIARVYNRYSYQSEGAEALARWARHVEGITGQVPAAEVVELHR